MEFKVEPHFFAAFVSSEISIDILEIFPDTDLIEMLKNIIHIQNDLFLHIIQGKHYGTDNLLEFMNYLHESKEEIRKLKNNS